MYMLTKRGPSPRTWHRLSKLCYKTLVRKECIMEEKLHLQFCIVHSKQLQRQSCSWLRPILITYQAYKKTSPWFKMCLHVCTHCNLTLQGTTMLSWNFIAHNYRSPVTYIFLTDFQEAGFDCCLLTSHSVPAPLLDWRHLHKQASPRFP